MSKFWFSNRVLVTKGMYKKEINDAVPCPQIASFGRKDHLMKRELNQILNWEVWTVEINRGKELCVEVPWRRQRLKSGVWKRRIFRRRATKT